MRMTACLLDRTLKLKVSTLLKSHKSEIKFVSSFRLCRHPGGIIPQSITRRPLADYFPTIPYYFPTTSRLFSSQAETKERPSRSHELTIVNRYFVDYYSIEHTCQTSP